MRHQMLVMVAINILAALSLPKSSWAAEPAVARNEIVTALQKSVPYIEESGWKWIRSKKCLSCHMITWMSWGLHEADSIGLEIDKDKLSELDTYLLPTSPKRGEGANSPIVPETLNESPNASDTESQILLAAYSTGISLSEKQNMRLNTIRNAQQHDGHWNPGGQLPRQKRKQRETTEVSTMWNMIALLTSNAESDDVHDRVSRARKYLNQEKRIRAENAESIEWLVANFLVRQKLGEPVDVQPILQHQNDDGGWGWRVDERSDALGTGQALYAIAAAGENFESQSVQSAMRFLINNQKADGSWPVRSTLESKRTLVRGPTSFWGTNWVLIGLSPILQTAPRHLSSIP